MQRGYPDTSFVSRLSVSGMEENSHICSWFTNLSVHGLSNMTLFMNKNNYYHNYYNMNTVYILPLQNHYIPVSASECAPTYGSDSIHVRCNSAPTVTCSLNIYMIMLIGIIITPLD